MYVFVFSLLVGTSFAGVVRVENPADWSGTWYSSDGGGIISISEKDGFLTILGKDDATIFNCAGIIEKNTAQCFGNGINHKVNVRFLYKTKLTIKENGQKIEEVWEALFPGGEKLDGKSTFSRKNPRELLLNNSR
jgi:hypothetical protein